MSTLEHLLSDEQVHNPNPGEVLQRWRRARRLSQLELASSSGVSQRHLSFLETGRSAASREMIVHLATQLDVPLRERNLWLRSAGFADVYPEHGLADAAMDDVREVLQTMLDAHSPFPAYVVDRAWTIQMANGSALELLGSSMTTEAAEMFGGNVLRMMLHPDGFRPRIENWVPVAGSLLRRFECELIERQGDPTLVELMRELLTYPDVPELLTSRSVPTAQELLVPIRMKANAGLMSYFTTISTIGAAYDVTLEELRLETLLPADAATRRALT